MSVFRVIIMFEPGSPAPYDVEGVRVVGGADMTQILDENNDAVLTVPTAKLVSVERLPDTVPSPTVLPRRGRSARRQELTEP